MHADEYWLQQAAAGEARALEVLFRRHVHRVFGLAYALLRAREEAEEVVTETFLRVFRFASEFRGAGSFEAWLLRIARNQCLERLRRPRLATLPLDEGLGADLRELLVAPDELDRTALRLHVERALDTLPVEYREVLAMRDVLGMSARETAAALGRSEPATRSLHMRARRALRDALRALEETGEGNE